jgi:hypothetical protein
VYSKISSYGCPKKDSKIFYQGGGVEGKIRAGKRENLFEFSAIKADACEAEEHRLPRAQFNHVNKTLKIVGDVARNSEF